MRSFKAETIGLIRPPPIHLPLPVLVILLVLCVGLTVYSFYRVRRGKSLRRSVRKAIRRWRDKRHIGST